jgi:hypothetical protein
MTRNNEDGARLEAKVVRSVVVLYEDTAARERAVGFCDQLVSQFWTRFEFDVSWWPFDVLEQAPAATDATEKAVRADLVVFAASPAGDFPGPLTAWIETWLSQRGEREGTLVSLMDRAASPGGEEGPRHLCLRNAAHRGAMDYLTHVPEDMSRSIPDSLDSYTQRADQVTSLLEDILHRQSPPPHLFS